MLISRRSFIIGAVILVATFAAYTIFAGLKLENLSNLASMTCAYAAAGILFFASKNTDRHQNRQIYFFLFALACLAWAIADTGWALLSFSGVDPGANLVVSVCYVLTNCFLLISVILFLFRQLIKWNIAQLIIDLVFNSFLFGLLIWLIFFEKDIIKLASFFMVDPVSGISILTDIFIIISVYSWLLSVRSGKNPIFLIIISVGLLLFSFIDLIYYYMAFNGLYYSNQLSDLLYALSLSIIAFGALWKIHMDKPEHDYRDLVNSGKHIKWFYILVYPIFTIGLIRLGFVSTKLVFIDYFLLIFPVIAYFISCWYIQKSIRKEKALSVSLAESERSKSALLNNLPGMAYRCLLDRQRTAEFVSDGCQELTGYTPERFYDSKGVTLNDITAPEYRESVCSEWKQSAENKKQFRYEYEIITIDSKRKWVFEVGEAEYDEEGDAIAMEGIIFDITDRRKMEEQVRYISEHDPLTGLYNSYYLDLFLKKDNKEKNERKKAAISINLSTFHLLTASFGYQYSGDMIKKVAATLSEYCNDKRMLFKTAEARFVIYLRDYKNKNELIRFTETIVEVLKALFVQDRISGGVGVVEFEQNQNNFDIDGIRRRLILATEKSIGVFDKDFRAWFYDKELELEAERENEIKQALSTIVADDTGDELFLQYQPILDMKTESICGFEALARLKTSELGSVTPGEFIPIAEKSKLIIPIGDKIILRALDFQSRLEKEGFEVLSTAINISVIQLLVPGFADTLIGMVHEKRIDPKNITIEITESVFEYDFDYINSVLVELRKSGLTLAIDDFGTGYSSLSREMHLDVDCIKIDKFFIDHILEIEKPITCDIIEIAHKQEHYVVGEGVEHVKQLQYLKDHGCDRVQGYLISKPLDEDVAVKFINEFVYDH